MEREEKKEIILNNFLHANISIGLEHKVVSRVLSNRPMKALSQVLLQFLKFYGGS